MGHYEFTVMPFGLINGPSAFADFMNRVSGHTYTSVVVFIQDILKYSKDKDDHTVYLRIVLQTLKEHQLHNKYKKCERWLEALVFWNIWCQRKRLRLI